MADSQASGDGIANGGDAALLRRPRSATDPTRDNHTSLPRTNAVPSTPVAPSTVQDGKTHISTLADGLPSLAKSSLPNALDPDTCRICRGEGTVDEPLFYPCRCSGSIKYVHQDCLMEWLSHSQKKHCELCKTPFRFTKLYSPDMPSTLPPLVFVGHMAQYFFRNLVIWLRGALVATVWLGVLPYLMRAAWSCLFWISDEGLGGGNSSLLFARNNGTGGLMGSAAAITSGSDVCPASPLFAETTTAASVGWTAQSISLQAIPRFIRSIYSTNFTSTDPIYYHVLRLLFGAPPASDTSPASHATNSSSPAVHAQSQGGSLLSEIAFLKHLTRSPTTNKIIIQVLEGQIITILVIISFILIILVRDYVVQQQPEARAAFAANDGVPEADQRDDRGVDAVQEDVGVPGLQEQAATAEEQEEAIHAELDGEFQDEEETNRGTGEEGETRSAATGSEAPATASGLARRRSGVFTFGEQSHTGASGNAQIPSFEMTSALSLPADGNTSNSASGSGSTQVPAQLRQLGGPQEDASTINEYLAIYREADGRPDRILDIVYERGLEDKLHYWVALTRTMKEKNLLQDLNTIGRQTSIRERFMRTNSDSGPSKPPASPRPESQASDDFDESPIDRVDWNWPSERSTARASSSYASRQTAATPDTSTKPAPQGLAPAFTHPHSISNAPTTPIEPLTAAPSALLGEPLERQTASDASPSDTASTPSLIEVGFSLNSGGLSHDQQSTSDDFEVVNMEASSSEQEDPAPAATDAGIALDAPTTDEDRPADPTAPRPPATMVERLADFMWQDVVALPPEELAALQEAEVFDNDDADLDEDVVEVAPGAILPDPAALNLAHPDLADDELQIAEEAAAAGLDAEAIEDAEDFEGIMELIGMRGPITGLFQNAIFCAFLVSVTIFVGIFLPYNIGRIAVWMVANPARPARMVFSLSKFIQDLAVWLVGTLLRLVYGTVAFVAGLVTSAQPLSLQDPTAMMLRNMSLNAKHRLAEGFMSENPLISSAEIRNFSALSHEALLTVKEHVFVTLSLVGQAFAYIVGGDYVAKGRQLYHAARVLSVELYLMILVAPAVLLHPEFWVLNLSLPDTASMVNPELAYWNGADRFWAVICGYLAFAFVAAIYLRRLAPISTSQTGQDWEAAIVDALNQACGVMKVVVIIGIEMLVFPLYCGMLLDIALMPLFENTSMKSRLFFTINYPLTSIFVHWFVGTGYMFHFALFVSMCRKIMRKGVLYFIRDPDDPEFHPVRDVLERNLTTQLRKIMFSALVYGGLVVICLGGVVWGLSLGIPGVLPIHYSSNEPVLEFPLDLLFYNFLMPLAVKTFRPSDGLHAMYTWWFRKCARALRITWYLFGERRIDEEGLLALAPFSDHNLLPWWKRVFLELSPDPDDVQVRPKTWHDLFDGGKAKPTSVLPDSKIAAEQELKEQLVETHQLIPDGHFVRTPASDQVKIPKGLGVFLAVTEHNQRTDGKTDDASSPQADLYSSASYQFVYIPPHFRLRIFAFILLIWAFAAVTGVAITIVPLVFGRTLFRLLIPSHIRTNDIYTFSIGMYILTSVGYAVVHAREIVSKAQKRVSAAVDRLSQHNLLQRAGHVVASGLRLLYAYSAVFVVFPFMVASLIELYLMIPVNTYMYSALVSPAATGPSPTATHSGASNGAISSAASNPLNPQHSVRIMQAWTVGIIYLKLLSRAIGLWFPHTRAAAARRAIFRRGMLQPDIKLLTRAFVIPFVALWCLAVLVPLAAAKMAIAWGAAATLVPPEVASGGDLALQRRYVEAAGVLVYRLSFPAMLSCLLSCFIGWKLSGVFASWRARIKDEAYLIGERLHNFGTGVEAARRKGAGWNGPRL